MTIDIKGDPGKGNTFMEISIEHVDNFYPAAFPIAGVNVSNKGTHARQQDVEPCVDTAQIRGEILDYVSRLRSHLANDWKNSYQRVWEEILDLTVVSASVYATGKQQGTNFNRSLVANIIHYLSGRGAYGNSYNAAQFALLLEGDKDHSVRSALGKDPSTDVAFRLDRYFEQ